MRVGISLLTLAPGDLGGSETYARQLVRALPAVRRLDYTVFVPAQAKDAAGSLPATEVGEPPVAAPRAGTHRGDGPVGVPLTRGQERAGDGRRGPLRAHGARAGDEDADRRDPARRAASGSSGVLRAGAALVPAGRVRPRDALGVGGHRDERVRARSRARAPRARPRGRSRDPARHQPHALPARRGGARAVHPLSRAALAAQEPRAAVRGVRHAPQDAAPAAPRPHGGRPRAPGQLPEGVERWGVVPAAELASLYRRAAVTVFPSLYEGFGLPPLEAMASGCPVAAADTAAIPEVCGDAAVLFDPLDPESIVAGILDADERSEELREKGLAHAAGFTWNETARLHEDAYVAAAAANE